MNISTTLQIYKGEIVIEEVWRDFSEPIDNVYRFLTGITAKNWLDNYNPASIGQPVYCNGSTGLYAVTGMIPKLQTNGGSLPVERRPIPPPKRVKEPYYSLGFWRNRKGEIA